VVFPLWNSVLSVVKVLLLATQVEIKTFNAEIAEYAEKTNPWLLCDFSDLGF